MVSGVNSLLPPPKSPMGASGNAASKLEYHCCNKSSVGTTIKALRGVASSAISATKVLPAPVGRTTTPLRPAFFHASSAPVWWVYGSIRRLEDNFSSEKPLFSSYTATLNSRRVSSSVTSDPLSSKQSYKRPASMMRFKNAWVRSSRGAVKSCSGGPSSKTCPPYRKHTLLETSRAKLIS